MGKIIRLEEGSNYMITKGAILIEKAQLEIVKDIISSEIKIGFVSGVSEDVEDIKNNLNMLYSTPSGTVALNRDFGLDWSFVDLPQEVAKSIFTAEVVAKTAKYEPRAAVSEVIWETSSEAGQLLPKVVIKCLA